MTQVWNAWEVLENLSPLLEGNLPNLLVFLDVDQTLISPISGNAFPILEAFKTDHKKDPLFRQILGCWRKQRQCKLLDPSWPAIIRTLQEKAVAVHGLTRIDIGSIGPIPSMQQWRWQELNSLGITFSPLSKAAPSRLGRGAFYKGIFLTGFGSKSEVISKYTSYLGLQEKSLRVVLADDRASELLAMQQWCTTQNISFTGFHFCSSHIPQEIPHLLKLQKHILVTHHRWVEDSEAEQEYLSFPQKCRTCGQLYEQDML